MNATTSDSTIQGFRVALALGDRNSQVWAMRHIGGQTLQAIGEHFGIVKERVRQLVKRADDMLARWPEPNAWQAALAPRLRELCALHDLASAQELADAVAAMRGGGRLLRGFTGPDLDTAAAVVRAQLTTWKVGEEVQRVVDALAGVAGSLAWLEGQGVTGAAQLRIANTILRDHGTRLFVASATDAAAIDAAATTEAGKA